MTGTTVACIFIGVLILIVGALAYFLFRKKQVTTVLAPTTPRMDQALQAELKTLADRATVQVVTDQAKIELDQIKALPDNTTKLARLAQLLKSAKNL